ncbi:hypothetical protein Pmani_025947 [Petrolisthes manimaculis]|uniref:Uncharacterized protein n=1 Tax=Petrolisthes manimaculis TaxID=1843537 RepID=A0AAE1TX53_9EUCA|nr:hypothetical protein Pmani_025947 [Petrolisthes manimaculis]
MIYRWGTYDPHKISIDDMSRASLVISDVLCEEDEQSSITGIVIIGDSEGMTASHVLGYTPGMMKKAMVLWQVMTNTR